MSSCIFCHGLIHLLDEQERSKFIKDCYDQLKPGGYLVITAISKEAPMYGKGTQLGKDYFEVYEGVKMYFYDANSIKEAFGHYGLIEVSEILEPHKNMENKPPFRFNMVVCQKK